ncbi:MAG: TerB family tellurite resistance protein [Pseudomonadota bacterium]
MLESLKRFFEKRTGADPGQSQQRPDDDILVAICALLVEMARIDEQFTTAEMDAILGVLVERYGLSPAHAQDIVAEADRALEDSLDLWQFARRINEHYTIAEKLEVVDTLWRIVYLDGNMDAHEHYLMGKLKNLLRLDHDQLIASKLKIKAEGR